MQELKWPNTVKYGQKKQNGTHSAPFGQQGSGLSYLCIVKRREEGAKSPPERKEYEP